MSNEICYDCIRKTECYTQYGVKQLKPNVTFKELTGCHCGSCFKNYEEAREFIYAIGDAIQCLDAKTRQKVMDHLADKYKTDVYYIELELNRDFESEG